MSAVIGSVFFGMDMNLGQWLSVVTVFVGMGLTSQSGSVGDGDTVPDMATSSDDVQFGVLVGLFGAVASSLEGIAVNRLQNSNSTTTAITTTTAAAATSTASATASTTKLKGATTAPLSTSKDVSEHANGSGGGGGGGGGSTLSPEDLSVLTGSGALCMLLPYYALYTWPQREWLVLRHLQVSWLYATFVWLGTCVSAVALNKGYFLTLKHCSPVETGMGLACRAVIVFVVSSMLWCSSDASQCMTVNKVAAIGVVVCGLAGFLRFAPPRNKMN